MASQPADLVLRLLQEIRAEQQMQATLLLALTEALRRLDKRVDKVDQRTGTLADQIAASFTHTPRD